MTDKKSEKPKGIKNIEDAASNILKRFEKLEMLIIKEKINSNDLDNLFLVLRKKLDKTKKNIKDLQNIDSGFKF
jgi:hypothetical protein